MTHDTRSRCCCWSIHWLVLLMALAQACADEPSDTASPKASEATPLGPFSLKRFTLINANHCTMQQLGDKALGASEAISITIPQVGRPKNNADYQKSLTMLRQTIRAEAKTGDVLKLSFWARSKTKNRMIVRLRTHPRSKENKYGLLSQHHTILSPQWTEYANVIDVNLEMIQRAGQGSLELEFLFGFEAGNIEIKNIQVLSYGANPHPYPTAAVDWFGGAAGSDTWRAPAEARIKKIRMGSITVKVVDAAGSPIPGAKVAIIQKQHKFRFGVAVHAQAILHESPLAQRYREEVKRHFNFVVFANDLKWHKYRPDQLRPGVAEAVDWVRQNGFLGIHGHCLYWPKTRFLPHKYRSLPPERLQAAVREHARQYTELFKEKIEIWDVINEARSSDRPDTLCGKDYAYLAEVFKAAHAGNPKARLAYNENGILRWENGLSDDGRNKFLHIVKALKESGAPIHLLGLQAHLWQPVPTMQKVIELLDEVHETTGLPLAVTEFTLECPDDDFHGQYTADFLTALFSHPAAEGVTLWNFYQGDTESRYIRNGAGFIRADWSYRPAMKRYDELVLQRWWSREKGTTGADGVLRKRVFLGDHDIDVSVGTRHVVKRVRVHDDKEVVIVVPP